MKSNEPLVSLIIPMYNSEKFIEKLLDTIVKQTYKNIEVIIVNDGSTDNSLNIALEYASKDDRIKIITTTNCGVSSARNTGLKYVRGEYFTFLDSDDYIELDMFEKIIDKISSINAQAIRVNYIKEDSEFNYLSQGNLYGLQNHMLTNQEIKNKLIPYIFESKIEAYSPLLLIKSDILKKIKPFNETINMMEDLLFYLDLLLNIDNIYLFDYPCYHYVVRDSSNSKRRDKLLSNLNDTVKVVNLVEQFLNNNNFNNDIYNQVYYIYSTMIVKYILRTFQKDDEYKLNLTDVISILKREDVNKIISKVKLNLKNEYIDTSLKLIKSKRYEEFYEYALSISNIKI